MHHWYNVLIITYPCYLDRARAREVVWNPNTKIHQLNTHVTFYLKKKVRYSYITSRIHTSWRIECIQWASSIISKTIPNPSIWGPDTLHLKYHKWQNLKYPLMSNSPKYPYKLSKVQPSAYFSRASLVVWSPKIELWIKRIS